MKLAKADVGFQSRGVQSKTAYQVAQTAKVMDMFSNMLYKNKIRAVIRELSTNAWDAHVMAGTTDKVPNIHLPSLSDPEFRLRDFGTGMSQEALEEMYQTYGASNKTHSNDFNGCMGIGSKSPFAYANSFVTTSYHNGKKYVYVNAKDRTGMPSMQKMLEEDTNEVNGLEISFAVDKSDIDEFKSEAEDVLRRFPKPFKVFCTHGTFKLKSDDYIYEGKGWKIRQYDYYNKSSYAIMGNVAYPIDPARFDYHPEDLTEADKTAWYKHYSRKADNGSKTRKFYTDILNLGLEIDFEVGEVEMDISREGLQYTKATVDAIKDKLDKISDSIEVEIANSIKNAKCKWEAALKLSEVMSGEYRGLRMMVDTDAITYDGKKLPTLFNIKDIKESEVVLFTKDSYNKNPSRTDRVRDIYVEPKTAFMIADKKVGNYIACQRFILNSNDKYKNVYLIKPATTNAKALKEIKELVGCTDDYFHLASVVPVPKGQKKQVDTQKVFECSVNKKNGYRDSFWTKADVELKDGGLYVEINNWNTRRSKTDVGFNVSPWQIAETVQLLTELGVTVPKVYGVKSAGIGKFDGHSKWQSFFDWAKAKLEDYIKTSNIKDDITDYYEYTSWNDKDYFSHALGKLVSKIASQKNILTETLDSMKKCDKLEKSVGEKVKKVRSACSNLGIDFPVDAKKVNSSKWDTIAKKIYAEYPVLKLMNRWDYGYGEKLNVAVEMVDLINSCKGN